MALLLLASDHDNINFYHDFENIYPPPAMKVIVHSEDPICSKMNLAHDKHIFEHCLVSY